VRRILLSLSCRAARRRGLDSRKWQSNTEVGLTKRRSERRTAVRSTFEMISTPTPSGARPRPLSLILFSLGPMQTRLRIFPCFLAAFVFGGCVTSPSTPEVQFSGVTRQDVREIELLVAQRADILKPVIRVHIMTTIPANSPRNGQVEVVAGRDGRVGNTFDTFTVAKRRGRWAITSPIQRDSILVIAH
jgi:hypothetical protein